jgi:hypothetical protein
VVSGFPSNLSNFLTEEGLIDRGLIENPQLQVVRHFGTSLALFRINKQKEGVMRKSSSKPPKNSKKHSIVFDEEVVYW